MIFFDLPTWPQLIGGFLALLLSYAIYNLYLHPLSRLPGPFWARAGLYSWCLHHAIKLDVAPRLEELHEKYKSKVVRIGRNKVSSTDCAALSKMYIMDYGWDKTHWYRYMRGTPDTLMSTQDAASHKAIRATEGRVFSPASVHRLESAIDQSTHELHSLLRRNIVDKDGTALPIGDYIDFYTMDLVGSLGFSRTFGLLKNGKDDGGLLDITIGSPVLMTIFGTHPNLFFPVLVLMFIIKGNTFVSLTQRLVKERFQAVAAGETFDDLAAGFMNCVKPDGSRYDEPRVVTASIQVVTAGSQTTSVVLKAVLYYLVKHPDVYKKTLAELDKAAAEGRLHFPVTLAEAQSLAYFGAVVKEAIRMHPSIAWPLLRLVPSGGSVVGGHYLPAGTHVGVTSYVLHRLEETFGPDPKTFRPERWLEASPEERVLMEKHTISFGIGSRVCIGKWVALAEIHKLLPDLLYHYSFALVPRTPGSPHQLPGKRLDQVLDDKEPWHVQSGFITTQHDFWLDVASRHE